MISFSGCVGYIENDGRDFIGCGIRQCVPGRQETVKSQEGLPRHGVVRARADHRVDELRGRIEALRVALRTVGRKEKRANAWQYRISVEAKG